jgi:hypothetical protein
LVGVGVVGFGEWGLWGKNIVNFTPVKPYRDVGVQQGWNQLGPIAFAHVEKNADPRVEV